MAMRPARFLAAAVLGLVLGGGSVLGLQQLAAGPAVRAPAGQPPSGASSPPHERAGGTDTAPPRSHPPEKAAPVPEPAQRLLLAWTSGGLPGGFAADVAALPPVADVAVVRGDLVELTSSAGADGRVVDRPPEGYVIPLDVVAYDPATYPTVGAKSLQPVLGDLADGEALLTATSARLRGLGEGATLTFASGHEVEVAGVVDDAAVGGAEVAVTLPTGEDLGVEVPRYLLVAYRGERAAVEQAIRDVAPDVPMRLRGPGETPVFRHGDAVLTQAAVKERFGEFSYRRAGGGALELDRSWVREHIVSVELPLLGSVRCHRAVVDVLRGALGELEERGLGALVDPEGFAGCHVARLVASGQSVSRHTWGIALDLNWSKNPVGQAGTQDPRLVEVLARWGFAWGGEWLVPDPAHFEWVRPAAPGVTR